MATITVNPPTFELVEFDAGEIEKLAAELCEAIGFPDDAEVEINVDEAAIIGRVTSRLEGRKFVVEATGGAFESLRKARTFDAERTKVALALGLLRARDRLDESFGEVPPDDEVDLAHDTAWTTYIEGRLARAGLPSRATRRIYHFRIRHGFTDASDAAFERLWNADGLTWGDIVKISDGANTLRAEIS